MKSFALVLFVAQAVIFQSAYSQVIRSSQILSGPIVGPALPCGCSPSILPAPVLTSSCGCTSSLLPAPVLTSTCGCSSPVLSGPVLSSLVSAPVVSASPVVVPSVANNLADTLSLLTVSSLLADTLPLNYPNVVSTVPVVGGCGCGGYGYTLY